MSTTPENCTIYLIRHGETELNVARRIQGHSDSPLTVNGVQQAEELAKRLGPIQFAAVYSSDLLRAKRTAEILTVERNLIIITSHLIREKSYGQMEGKTFDEYETEVKQLLDQFYTLTEEEKPKHRPHPSVETDFEATTRMLTFLREVAVSHQGQNVLIVCHGGILKALLVRLGFAKYTDFERGAIQNCAVIKVDSDGTDFFIRETSGVTVVR